MFVHSFSDHNNNNNNVKESIGQVRPRDGKWTMQRQHLFNDGKQMKNWGLLDLVNTDERTGMAFLKALHDEGGSSGLSIDRPTLKKSNERDLEKDFVQLYTDLSKKGKPDIIMVFVPVKDSNIYATVKMLGDIIYGMPTQVILRKNTIIGPKSGQTIHNICLKLNSKLGGINQILSPASRPAILNTPVSSLTINFVKILFECVGHFAHWSKFYLHF
jgi:hypothetical protein